MAALNDITNPVWGLSTLGYGVIVEGIAVIRQRMDIAIRTTKGTDPLRAEFGSNVYKYQDYPVNIAVPNIKKELLECLSIWVKDIKVISIKHYLKTASNPVFEIYYRLINDEIIDRLIFDLEGGGILDGQLSEIILTAYYPVNPNNYRYQIKFLINGSNVTPLPPPSGFPTIQEMFNWIQTNYSYLGRWFMLSNRIICQMSSAGITSASLEIQVLPIVIFQADFPQLNFGESYMPSFQANGVNAVPDISLAGIIFTTPGQVLSWVQSNWGNYATWSIEYTVGGYPVFTDEFSDEFNSEATGYRLVGVSNIPGFVGILSIINI